MDRGDFHAQLKQYRKDIEDTESKIRELENKYYLDELFAKGFFRDEYRKFKEKTGKILIACYTGGNSMDVDNYSFKIVDKDTVLSNYEKEIGIDFLFEDLVIKLYDNLDNQLPMFFDKLLSKTFNIKL